MEKCVSESVKLSGTHFLLSILILTAVRGPSP